MVWDWGHVLNPTTVVFVRERGGFVAPEGGVKMEGRDFNAVSARSKFSRHPQKLGEGVGQFSFIHPPNKQPADSLISETVLLNWE